MERGASTSIGTSIGTGTGTGTGTGIGTGIGTGTSAPSVHPATPTPADEGRGGSAGLADRSGIRTGHQGFPNRTRRDNAPHCFEERSRPRRWRARACGGPRARGTVSRTNPLQGPHGGRQASQTRLAPEEAIAKELTRLAW